MLSVCIRMLVVGNRVLLVCIRMLSACIRTFLVGNRMLLVCIRMLSVFIIQQIVALSKYGHDALDICHP